MSSGSFVHAICPVAPALCRVGEGLLPERSIGLKEARVMKTTEVNARMTMTDKGRLLTDSTVCELTHSS